MVEDRHPGTPGGGGFTYEYSESVESDTPVTNANDAFVVVHTHTVVTAGDYIVMWNFELSEASAAIHVFGRVLHNTTVIGNYRWEFEDTNPDPYQTCAGFRKRTLAVNDTITIEHGQETTSGTVRTRRCRILLIAA